MLMVVWQWCLMVVVMYADGGVWRWCLMVVVICADDVCRTLRWKQASSGWVVASTCPLMTSCTH